MFFVVYCSMTNRIDFIKNPSALSESRHVLQKMSDDKKRINVYIFLPFRPLYFVKLDLQACYDSINEQKLFKIIENILKQVYSRVINT